MITSITLFGMTDVGEVRDHNEDDFAICQELGAGDWSFRRGEVVPLTSSGALLLVADGMGGTNAGEVASDLAQRSVRGYFAEAGETPTSAEGREEFLRGAIVHAHQAIVEHQHANLETAGMGTTLAVAWIVDGSVHVAWSGDSRCYILHPDDFDLPFPFTDDHSVVWDLVRQGALTPEEARVHEEGNLITQSLGDPENPPKPSSRSTPLYQGSRVMVCSDGLNGMIPDPQIRQLMAQELEVSDITRQMVQIAKNAGGHDNITCLMAEVVEGPAASDATTTSRAASASGAVAASDPDEASGAAPGPGDVEASSGAPAPEAGSGEPVSASASASAPSRPRRRWTAYFLVALVAAVAGAFLPRFFGASSASPPAESPPPTKEMPKVAPEDAPAPAGDSSRPGAAAIPDTTAAPDTTAVPDTPVSGDSVVLPDTLILPDSLSPRDPLPPPDTVGSPAPAAFSAAAEP